MIEINKYIEERLKSHDPLIFDDSYTAKVCQHQYRPIVMKNNPENDSTIDRESFTYALKYGSDDGNQNYYICPKVWCPNCEKPILYSKVKNIHRHLTKNGNQMTGECPDGDHDVFIFLHDNRYPGFLKQKNSNGFKYPSVFRKPQ